MRINPEDLIIFMESKEEELTSIIKAHAQEDPSQIAKAIIEGLNYHRLTMSLIV